MYFRRFVGLVVAGVASTLVSVSSMAIPISVSQDGADVTVSYSLAGQTASFEYLFSVGSAANAASWIGTTMDSLSIQFGGNSDALVESLSTNSTNSANVAGEWTGYRDKQSGQGCFAGTFDAACYTRGPTGVGGSGTETLIAALTSYWFKFDVIFKSGVDVPAVLAGSHSIKFLSLKYNASANKWQTGVQLSQSGIFTRDDPDTPPDIPPNRRV